MSVHDRRTKEQKKTVQLQREVLYFFQSLANSKNNARTLEDLLHWINTYRRGSGITNHYKDTRAIRAAIKSLRLKGEPIVSLGGVGHWYAQSRQEVFSSVEAELLAKAKDLLRTARVMRKSAVDRFGRQEEMFASDTQGEG